MPWTKSGLLTFLTQTRTGLFMASNNVFSFYGLSDLDGLQPESGTGRSGGYVQTGVKPNLYILKYLLKPPSLYISFKPTIYIYIY
jgi:hypothetical protein